MEGNLSYYCVEPHLNNLRFSGAYQLDAKSTKSRKILHTFYRVLILVLLMTFMVQQLLYIYQVKCDPNKVIDTVSLLLTHSDTIYKQLVMWMKAGQIEQLLNIMKGPIFNPKEAVHQAKLLRTERQGRLFLRVFNVVALLTCLMWALFPVILCVQGRHVEFSLWLPFDTNTNSKFIIGAVYVWVQTSWIAFNNTTMDAYISVLLAQCKTQLSILSFTNTIQRVFGSAVLYQFFVSSWIICTTAHRIVNINPVSLEFVSMVMYMSCILTELLLFCYFGNEVTHESESLLKSAYSMNWLDLPLTQQRNLIIFMESIKRPLKPMAGVIIPLSNSTFLSVLRSSYSFYAFLKNTSQ